MEIKILTPAERRYTYSEDERLDELTGCIGHLRADFGNAGDGFYSNWYDHVIELKSQDFKDEINTVINTLRSGNFLQNRKAMSKYCYSHSNASYGNDREWGIRVDTDKYAYLMRLNPHRGEYNLYCYCYERDKLDRHIKGMEDTGCMPSSSLPEKCFVYVESTDEIGVVTRGEAGNIPTGQRPAGVSMREGVDALNETLDVTKAQAAAMYAGSLFGWDIPAADPANYDADGRLQKPGK